MRRSSQSSPSRGGFTLVELLVVITIIAIMFALISAAAVKIMGKGDEVRLRSEISQLSLAVNAFKQQFAVGYVPDRIVLPPGAPDPLDPTNPNPPTKQYFKSVWTRLNPAVMLNDNTSHAYWGVPNNQTYVLQGDQALVFWLGGPGDAPNNPLAGNRLGWSSDPTDPMKTSGSRIQTFYEFPTDRLKAFSGTGRAPAPSFVDIYGSAPYLYFSTNKADNNYQSTVSLTLNGTPIVVTPFTRSGVIGSTTNPPKFVNPSSFQIISAGKDGAFGNGASEWAGYSPNGGTTLNGNDDVANFHSTFLGVPAQ